MPRSRATAKAAGASFERLIADHRLVKNTGNSGMHLEPIEEASCSPLF